MTVGPRFRDHPPFMYGFGLSQQRHLLVPKLSEYDAASPRTSPLPSGSPPVTPRSPRITDFLCIVSTMLKNSENFTKLHLLDSSLSLISAAKFPHEAIQLTKGFIQNGSFEVLIEQAKKDNTEVITSIQDLRIFISKLGRIKAGIEVLGAGKFKTTNKVVLVATPFIEDMKKEHKCMQAYSITKSTLGFDPASDAALRNELEINLKLKQIKKASPNSLSHVLVSKAVVDMSTGQIGIISEYCNGGDFDHLIGSAELETMPLERKYKLCTQMAEGVAELHLAGVVHRDLHTGNFLIKRDLAGVILQIKVADFGLSSLVDPEKRYFPSKLIFGLLPQGFVKGNSVSEDIFSPKLDVHELGVTYYLLFIGIKQRDLPQVMAKNKGKQPDSWHLFSTIPAEMRELIKQMVHINADKRPTMKKVVAACKDLARK